MQEREKEFRTKYKCTASENGGWCNGTKVGSRMRCPAHSLTKNRDRICDIGIQEGLDASMRI